MSVSADKISLIEGQINKEKSNVDYDTREFTVEYIVDKYLSKTKEEFKNIKTY